MLKCQDSMWKRVRYQMNTHVSDEGHEDQEDRIRDADAIARRALALFAVVAIACGEDKQKLTAWLRAEDLWTELTPTELEFLSSDSPSERQVINASWRSEALVPLLWALGLLQAMPDATEACVPSSFGEFLPPYAPVSVRAFIESVQRRTDEELWAMADEVLSLHWKARDASLNGRACPEVHTGIIQERHHGINWVIGYDGAAWDEITTDT